MRRILCIVALSFVVAPSASAEQLKMAFGEGRVTIDATSVSVRAILAEWGKLGGTKVVNGERVTGAPLTLTLVDVPEAQALAIILRSVAGYVAAPRRTTPGASMYDRILVMPTSTSAAASARPVTPAAAGPASGAQRFVPPSPRQAVPAPDAEEPEEPEEEAEDPTPSQPVFTFPQPGQGGFGPGQIPPNPNVPGQPIGVVNPSPAGTPPARTGVGVVGAPMPGMIQQPVQPPAVPGDPGQPVRPPGR